MDSGNNGFVRAFIRAPMLRAAVPFVLGLIAAKWLPFTWGVAWALVVVALVAWFVVSLKEQAFISRWANGMAFVMLLLGLGVLWQTLHEERRRKHHVDGLLGRAAAWEMELTAPPVVKGRTVRAWASARAALVDGAWRPAVGGVLLTLMGDGEALSALAQGDRLMVQGGVEPIARVPSPGGFDVRQWAAGREVFHQAFVAAERWRLVPGGRQGPGLFERARQQVNGWLHRSGLPERERALVKALLLGQRDELDSDQTQAFVRSGTIHVLAVSGTHVGIVYGVLVLGLAWMAKDRRGRLLRGLLALLVLWGYAGITGFAPSVLRATVMFSLFTIAEMTRWRVESLNSLAAAAVLLLLWDPSMLYQLSFQLSFLAVLGIIVFYDPLHRLWTPPNMVLRFLWSVTAVSLAAQALTTPLCLYMFRAFPVWFLPANVAIAGLISLLVPGGIVLLLVHGVPLLGTFVAVVLKWLLLALGFFTWYFADLPMAYPALRVGAWGMVGLYVLCAALGFWLVARRPWGRPLVLATTAALLLGWAGGAAQRNARHEFAVYPLREGLACAYVQGRTLHLFAAGADTRLESTVDAHVRHAGIRRVVRNPALPGMVRFAGEEYLFLDPARRVEGPGEAAVGRTLILHGRGRWDLDVLERAGASAWVLAMDLESGARRALLKRAAQKGIPAFDMRSAGAYVRASQ